MYGTYDKQLPPGAPVDARTDPKLSNKAAGMTAIKFRTMINVIVRRSLRLNTLVSSASSCALRPLRNDQTTRTCRATKVSMGSTDNKQHSGPQKSSCDIGGDRFIQIIQSSSRKPMKPLTTHDNTNSTEDFKQLSHPHDAGERYDSLEQGHGPLLSLLSKLD